MLMLYILGVVILFAIVADIALNAYIINKFPKEDADGDVVYTPEVFDTAKALSEMVAVICDRANLPQEIKNSATQNAYDAVLASYRLGFKMGGQE